MSASTTPDSIVYPVVGDAVAPLGSVFANMASSVQAAFTRFRTNLAYPVASATERNARFPSPSAGDQVFRTDTLRTEMYLTTAFAPSAGWYAVGGALTYGTLGHAGGMTVVTDAEFLEREPNGKVTGQWSATYTSGLADGSNIGTIPTGFRPKTTIDVVAAMSVGGAAGTCMVTISTGGVCTVYGITGSGNRRVTFNFMYYGA